jgi:hypothetical protein
MTGFTPDKYLIQALDSRLYSRSLSLLGEMQTDAPKSTISGQVLFNAVLKAKDVNPSVSSSDARALKLMETLGQLSGDQTSWVCANNK